MKDSIFREPVYRRFATKAPIATAVQIIIRRLIHPEAIDQVFDDNAEHQDERVQLFSTITSLMASVILSSRATVRGASRKRAGDRGGSSTALYNERQPIEPQTSREVVRYSYRRAAEIQRMLDGAARHDIPGYQTRILDGNDLGKTEHRLKETHAISTAPLPGNSLAVLDPRFKTICDFIPIEEGHAQELSGLDQIIETLEADQLWIADRNFCTLKFMHCIAMERGCFIIRQDEKLEGEIRGKEKKIGETSTGVVYENELVLPQYLGKPMGVRRVVIKLNEPARDDDRTLVLLTNLPVEDADAIRISELYRTRWNVETAFQRMTKNLKRELETACCPAAALFCFALSAVALNALSLIKSLVAYEHGPEASESLSHFYLCEEITGDTQGLLIVIEESRWDEVATMPFEEFFEGLLEIAASIDMKVYRKSIRGPKKPSPKKKGNKRTVHVSTKQILDKRKEM